MEPMAFSAAQQPLPTWEGEEEDEGLGRHAGFPDLGHGKVEEAQKNRQALNSGCPTFSGLEQCRTWVGLQLGSKLKT